MEYGREPLFDKSVYFCITGLLFASAIIIAIARISIRMHKFRRIFADDYFFLLAFLALISSNGILYYIINPLYLASRQGPGLEDPYILEQKLSNSYTVGQAVLAAEILAWTTILSVKFSFLLYFRTLIKRLRALMILWWCALFFCVPIACVTIVAPFIQCPILDTSYLAIQCDLDFHLYWPTITDIVTDFLIISIPICLLRKAHFDVRPKINIGLALCLSIFMIAIGGTRDFGKVSGKRESNMVDFLASSRNFRKRYCGFDDSIPDTLCHQFWSQEDTARAYQQIFI